MGDTPITTPSTEGSSRRLFLLALFTVGLLTIGWLVSNVRTELADLETATSDNVQWNLSQLEVEHLTFLSAVQRAENTPSEDLSDLRRRFDVLYSRISTLQSGALYSVFRSNPETWQSLEKLQQFLEETVPLIDGADDVLRQSLPAISARVSETRAYSRAIALAGITHFSNQRDLQRQSVYETLFNIAVLTVLLLVALMVLVFFLMKLNRLNRYRVLQNERASSRMSAIVTTSLDAIVAVNRNGDVLNFNGAAEHIFGYTEAEVVGRKMADLIIPEHLRAAHDAGMKRYLETGEQRVVGKGRVRLEAKRKCGEVFPVEFSIAEAMGRDSEIFVSYLRDISKEVQAEDELRKARDAAIAGEMSKSRFLAVMSHEMRTPLNGLLGTMELLGDTELSEKQRRFLHIMEKSGNLLLSHVNDVLDISRLEAGKNEFDESIFDLQSMIAELVEGQAASAEAHGNTLRFTSESQGQLLVETDRLRLRQVLLNLIGNAIKFTRNGEITVETETLPDNQKLEIRVADTGVGIADDRREQIFEDFVTLDSSFGRRADGTGLGLGIARRITEGLGGEIGVESEVGEGSLFWLRLPIALQYSQESHAHDPVHDPSAKPQIAVPTSKNILLVEDNQINREVARNFLEGDQHRVTEAHDGREGVALAAQNKFDLILMDISMPEMDGMEATHAIRSGNGPSKDTPIFAFTAHTQAEELEQFLAVGMNDAIVKPVTRQGFRNALSRLESGANGKSGLERDAQGANVIDLDVITQFQSDIGEKLFPKLLAKFIAEMDEEFATLGAQIDALNDQMDLSGKAHRLSGSAAMFGAHKLRRALKAIEEETKSEHGPNTRALVLKASSDWTATRQELTRHFQTP